MNSVDMIKHVQQTLATQGHYTGAVDGNWGPRSQAAWDTYLQTHSGKPPRPWPVTWGAKVSPAFLERVAELADQLQMPGNGVDALMGCMAWESGGTFSASTKNMAGSGAVGLIQFMPATAEYLGTTTAKLAALTAVQQLDYVYRYFEPYTGRLKNLGDVYMAILWPKGIGKPDDWVLWDQTSKPVFYRQNAGLDLNRDGGISRGECLAKVQERLLAGRQTGNLGFLV